MFRVHGDRPREWELSRPRKVTGAGASGCPSCATVSAGYFSRSMLKSIDTSGALAFCFGSLPTSPW
jgi:hypothetical protein